MKNFMSAHNSGNNTKIISRTYSSFLQRKPEDALYIKDKCDRESNGLLLVYEWYKICQIQWKTTRLFSIWREFCWKSLARFFIIPLQKLHRTTNSNCRRLCHTDNSNHYRIFWSCPLSLPYWKKSHQTLDEVFKIPIPFRF